MSIHCERGGLHTSVQDLGRPGMGRYGVPTGGALDPLALRVANLLAGNGEGEAALEMIGSGAWLRFERVTTVAIGGGDLGGEIDGVRLPLWHQVVVPAGALLRFHAAREGHCCYLAVRGGIDLPLLLSGRGMIRSIGLAGLQGRTLSNGDVVPLAAEREHPSEGRSAGLWPGSAPDYRGEPLLRLIPGPAWGRLHPYARKLLLNEPFAVSPHSDRVGCRLDGPELRLEEGLVHSEGTVDGAVQLPASGAPIVLRADRGTTGGYPVIAVISAVDLPRLAQVAPGRTIRFALTTLEEAWERLRRRERWIARVRAAVRAQR